MDIAAADLLESYANPALQQMARQRNIDLKGKNAKAAMIQALAPTLYAPEAVARALADLEPVERALLDHLILMGGEAPTDVLRGQLEAEGWIDPPRKPTIFGYSAPDKGSPWARASRKFADVVARLGVLGLVFTTDPQYATKADLGVPQRRLFIPDTILRELPPVTLPTETTTAPPTVQAAAPDALLRDVYVLLSEARATPLPLTTRGTINKRVLVRLDEAFRQPEGAARARGEDDLSRLPLLRALAEQLGLLAVELDTLALGPRAAEFLRRPAGERHAQLYAAYRETTSWSEMARIGGLAPPRGAELLAAEPRPSLVPARSPGARWASPRLVAARQRVLAELAELPPEEWIAFDHLIDRLRRRAYEFLYPRNWPDPRYGYYYAELNPYGYNNPVGWTLNAAPGEAKGWALVEARFIRVVVGQALHTLGVVDLGWSDGTLSAFRITADGARLLRGEPLPAAAGEGKVVVQPNFQIFAFPPTGEDVLFELDEIAERVRAEQAVEYRLTRESVYAAQRRGREAAEIIAFLERVSSAPLPQNVRRSLEEWGAQHDRIVVRRGVPLLHALDAATLDALYADAALAPLLGRRVAPTAALVQAQDLTALYAALLQRDLLPALTEGLDDLPGPQIAVAADGRITPCQRVPSVYTLQILRAFADEGKDGTLRLTPESLRRGAQAHHDAETIIGLLTELQCGAPLAPEAAALVRQWAKDWGRGALLPVTLLQVERAEVLDALLADPAVAPDLQRLPGAATLAVVREGATRRVRAALATRGMALDSQLLS
ncbi:MAG TPA: helicase-associated domain-containing protein [Chloroflexota bacterium]|nr:helicase-associated domain-containing protein [Chloroflexota bacterium]